ncbi:MBL fold metallo-hydrolase [Bacteroidota bacterium]
MQVKRFTNSILSSNSYLLYTEENTVWLVDPGDSQPIMKWLEINSKSVKGILLTHYHVDHIYGVNDFCEEYPELKIYTSEQSLDGLFSAKLNGSYYMEMTYEVSFKDIQIVDSNSEIELFDSGEKAGVLLTPGHNNDCISFEIGKYLFTGDALIPGVKVHTKSKQGDKLIAHETISRIIEMFPGDTIICPGHKEIILLKNIKIEELFTNKIFEKA